MKRKIVVLYGGKADEHSISCISAAGVLNAIDRELFEPIPVGITREGVWVVNGEDPRNWNLEDARLPEVTISEEAQPVVLDLSQSGDGFYAGNHDALIAASQKLKGNPTALNRKELEAKGESLQSFGHVDAVFPVLHGPFGEDGTVQGLLEMIGIPYVGCGVLSSAVCMDKHYTKILLQSAGIPVVPGITVDARKVFDEEAIDDCGEKLLRLVREAGLTYPVFVKPSRAGSSYGVTKVKQEDANDIVKAVQDASRYDWKLLIEKGIEAREIECAVMSLIEGGVPQTSCPGEIVLNGSSDDEFYDFDNKYIASEASHIELPAHLPKQTLQKIQQIASDAFQAVDGRGLSRVDCFVCSDGEVMVNEINTMPGFTPISMYSKAWEASGIPYSDVITQLIRGAIE
jgi:D-alanine-D-alanine ligase